MPENNPDSSAQQNARWLHAQRLFMAALPLFERARAEFLRRECGGDTELLADVESLLDHDQQESSLDGVFAATAGTLMESDSAAGRRIGSYRIEAQLGQGGMGVVYLAARADDEFHKKVAIKVVKRGMDTNSMLLRFRRERQILANLDHPHIARLMDGGSTDGHQPFFVMEYVEGKPIDEYCRTHQLTSAERCRLFFGVCEAVAYAHRNLVVHRDLKPSNILVTSDGKPKLLDFGVAQFFDPAAEEGAQTNLAERAITMEYASPEQVRGLPVTTASDIYSLALVLYEILSDSRARVFTSRSQEEMERVVCETALPPLTTSRGMLPGDLENILGMATRLEPERRYASVDHFAADLKRYLEDRPVEARPDTLGYRVSKFTRRNRAGVTAAALVLISVILGVAVSLREAHNADIARSQAVAAAQLASRERANAESHARRAELARAYSESEHAAAERQRARAQTQAGLARREQMRAEQRLTQMVELANRSLFDVHNAIERLPGATAAREAIVKTTLAYLETASNEAGTTDDRLRMALATAYLRVGDIEGSPGKSSLGKTDDAMKSYTRAGQLLEPLMAVKPRKRELLALFVDVGEASATALIAQGRANEGIPPLLRAEEAAAELNRLAPDDPRQANLHSTMVNAYRPKQPEQAILHARQGIEAFEKLAARQPGNHDVRWGLSGDYSLLASLLLSRDNSSAALENFQKSARLREELVVQKPDDSAYRRSLMISYGQIASIFANVNGPLYDSAEARAGYRKAVAIGNKMVAADDKDRLAKYDLASGELRLAGLEYAAATDAENRALLQHAKRLLDELVLTDPRAVNYRVSLATVHLYLGNTLKQAGEAKEALGEFRSALSAFDARLQVQPDDVAASNGSLSAAKETSLLLAKSGDKTGSLELARKALLQAGNQPSGTAPTTRTRRLAEALLSLASIELQFGEWEAARNHGESAIGQFRSLRKPGGVAMFVDEVARAERLVADCSARLP